MFYTFSYIKCAFFILCDLKKKKKKYSKIQYSMRTLPTMLPSGSLGKHKD